ncbi:pantoate--beta-alanine ligase [Sporosarcina sp. Te-1]|uniref:pantoate--beta-alanine ligase n=1 Tax=Sporosarcina sp. Te-1 TaxID=2818390 RepID=UPI001A9D97BA|nr:pantoate--beta-alanine ligase [Sporosarcina sp. Te-1]QTD42158.1 pantoate--beta-alanine ligase [Sporosarcina sp. Te-1]
MKVVTAQNELNKLIDRSNRNGKSVGYVPTMGFLHEGHLSLVSQAKANNDIVVMSIFVNPAQFGPGEDYEAYPRDLERDVALAEKAGVDFVFAPSVEEMYPTDGGIRILPGQQADVLCGASRLGHFDGVLKVLLKLFNIVDPDRSYFGMKDAQQLAIIETFVRDYFLRTEIVRVPTVRESDGLAKSSRNVNLSETERLEAPFLYQALQMGQKRIGVSSPDEIEKAIAEFISKQTSGIVDYAKVLSYPSLSEVSEDDSEIILACAVKFSKTRLIDNIIMSTKDDTSCSE